MGETIIISVNVVPYLMDSYGTLSIYKKPFIQLMVFLFGFWLATLLARLNYRYFFGGSLPYILLLLSLFSLVVVLLKKFISGKSVERWLFGFSVQPLEFAKISLIIFLSYYIVRKGNLRQWKHFLWAMFSSFFMALLLVLQPDRGGALFILIITALLVYVGGVPKRVYAVMVPLMLLFVYHVISSKGYVAERLSAWKDPFLDPEDSGYQIIQSLYALARGGIMGVGIGQSFQKMGPLPASDTDYVIAIIGEEMGFLGVLTVLLLYSILVGRLLWHSIRATELLAKLLLFGIAINFALSFFWNLAMVSNLIPPKGIALPFISYGSSNLFASLLALGIAQSVINYKDSTSFSFSRTPSTPMFTRQA
ncbi:MAG: FtsW/RodA/SpoVE family cell cycle protein [Aquificaceae bacterium]|nr:FtsW/RodA/SpoVE family cell cycle protein [Aquificaceae bacterium]MCX8164970.1 FtsW/RodA/SpoVE family cell cycle protein [Aquificaceae bacterium]